MVVLIPAFGAYLIPDLVGGPTSELVGDKIAQRVFNDRNLPHASALSALLMMAVFLPLIGTVWIRKLKSRKANAEVADA
jgi:spermidine/putrescine transport system permease protein